MFKKTATSLLKRSANNYQKIKKKTNTFILIIEFMVFEIFKYHKV